MNKKFAQFSFLLTHPIFLFLSGLVFPCLAWIYYLNASSSLTLLEKKVFQLHAKVEEAQRKKEKEELLLQHLKKTSSQYVEKELESSSFLEPEIKRLKALLYLNPSDEKAQKRLETLQGKGNRLRFKEVQFQKISPLQQTQLEQEHPVEMNRKDLLQLLAKIENITLEGYTCPNGSPNFLVRSFDLKKKPLSTKEEVFVISFSLTKQELLHE